MSEECTEDDHEDSFEAKNDKGKGDRNEFKTCKKCEDSDCAYKTSYNQDFYFELVFGEKIFLGIRENQREWFNEYIDFYVDYCL